MHLADSGFVKNVLVTSTKLAFSRPAATPYFRSTRILNYGWKRYEVNDHLGNVRALINDRKTYGGATFAATLLDATDYFPFGAEMRKGTAPAASYRYGFNGKELDKNGEFGSLNHYDYGFRIYNPGIGRFLSVDPLTQKYPELTPYQFASNTPICAIDLDGLEATFNYPSMVSALENYRAPDVRNEAHKNIATMAKSIPRPTNPLAGTSVHSPSLFKTEQKHRATAGTVSLTRTIIPVSSRHTSMHAGMKKAQIKLGWGKRALWQGQCRVLSKRPGRPTNPSLTSLNITSQRLSLVCGVLNFSHFPIFRPSYPPKMTLGA